MSTADDAYHEVAAYTLGRGDAEFIHQYVVDATAIHRATASDKPIRVAQALVGLFLHVEHGLTGREVQRVHQLLASRRTHWPMFVLPEDRGSITVQDVLAEPPGSRRDRAIEAWAASTWEACRSHRESIRAFLTSYGISPPVA
ncbi:MAG: DUF5946 family protein [Actinomycetota bacterium]